MADRVCKIFGKNHLQSIVLSLSVIFIIINYFIFISEFPPTTFTPCPISGGTWSPHDGARVPADGTTRLWAAGPTAGHADADDGTWWRTFQRSSWLR